MTETDQPSLGDSTALLEGAVDDAPAVVAVVVTRDPSVHLEDLLGSLAAQDYPNLSVLVVDAASEHPVADRVAAALPEAFLHRLGGSPTISGAANQGASLVDGAPFLLLCTDDVALEPDCVTQLVVGLYRSNAGIVTPKIVRWDDARRLRRIGLGADRFGVPVDLVDPNEFDQDQYDSLRDVFVAPLGVQLVRADLFTTLGGFDTVTDAEGIDVDLSWRAQLLGARIVAVPRAKVRQAEPDDSIERRRRDATRQRLRTVLTTTSRGALVRIGPMAVGLIVLEALYCLLAGRRRQAGTMIGALTWNLSNWGGTRARRRELAAKRTVDDKEIHGRQVGGSARISHYFREQLGSGQDRVAGALNSMRASVEDRGVSGSRVGLLVATIVGFVMLFGSRHLLTRGVSFVGQIPVLPDDGTLIGEWWGTWRSGGIGRPGAPPTAFALLGVAQSLTWSNDFLELLLVVVPIMLGIVGAWGLVRPLGSVPASAASCVAYAFNPLLLAILAAGRWDALVLWGAAPILLGSILRLQGLAPYGVTGGDPGPGVEARLVPARLLRLGVAVTGVSVFVPGAIALTLALVASVVLASLVTLRRRGLGRLGLGAVVAVVVPIALHGPWGLELLARGDLRWFLGTASPLESFDSMADLVRFAPSSPDPAWTALGLAVAALVVLAIGRGVRFDLGVVGWVAALASFLALWATRRSGTGSGLDAEAVLVMAAVGLSLAVGASVRSMELDGRNGLGRVVSIVGLLGLVGLGAGAVRNSLDGNWGAPQQGYGPVVTGFADGASTHRTLWLAAPEIAPFDTAQSAGGVSFAVVDQGAPDVRNRWLPGDAGGSARLGAVLDLAAAGDTVHLGRLLAVWGIDTVVWLPQLVPYEGATFDPGFTDPVGVLDAQVDLRRVTGVPGLIVFENRPSVGVDAQATDLEALGPDPADALGFDIETLQAGTFVRTAPDRWEAGEATTPGSTEVLAVPAEGWAVSAGSATLSSTPSGFLAVGVDESSDALVISHSMGWGRRLWLLLQLVLVAAAILLAQTRPEGREA